MFNGFTKATSDFFWELAFNNERTWFLEHKDEFERTVNTPFKALAAETNALMSARHPEMECSLHVSRIYRDARRLFGRGPYKDHLWFSIKNSKALLEGPMFWFEVGAADFSYGMGFYSATAANMQRFREIVDANPAAFESLIDEIERYPEFVFDGERYSRPKGTHNEKIDRWYNCKRLGVEHREDFGGAILSPDFPEVLAGEFEKLIPLYEFCLRFYFEES